MPMRVSDDKASMAVSAMERGDTVKAVQLGHEALDMPESCYRNRRSWVNW